MEEKIRAMKEILKKHYKVLKGVPKPDSSHIGGTYSGSTELLSSVGNHLKLVEDCAIQIVTMAVTPVTRMPVFNDWRGLQVFFLGDYR